MALLYPPRRHAGKNYPTCDEFAERHSAELARLRDERHYHEGPLLYAPWVVNSQGGIYKEEKDKYRIFIDGTASGNNPASAHLAVVYDLLDDVLGRALAGAPQSGVDMTDAFYNWAYTHADSDYWGIMDPELLLALISGLPALPPWGQLGRFLGATTQPC